MMNGKDRKNETIRVILTARDTGDHLARQEDLRFVPDESGQENALINVYPDVAYQEIEGFGGAFTEAAAYTLSRISPDLRQAVIDAYFDPTTGLGYSLCRTHINSCDFSLGNYDYTSRAGDVGLETFSIAHDRELLIPLIRSALLAKGSAIKILASPWSPPAWMKTNNQMNQGGKLRPEFRSAWANYFSRYISAYAQEGIPIWAVSVQNEPKAVQTWDSCIFTAEDERDFVRDHLGPALERDGHGRVKILVWDHNKERVYERAKVTLADPAAARYIWGVAVHWYSGDHFEGLALTHDRFPDKKLLFTEGCVEKGVHLGEWSAGERYAHDIIGDLNHWAVGWIDWNMVLDEQGGPNHVGNYCDAPIIADTQANTLTYESSYYYMGHLSRYIQLGARRIGWSRFTDRLEVTAARNPDGEIAVVVMNRRDEAIPFTLRCESKIAQLSSPPHSIMTLLYRL